MKVVQLAALFGGVISAANLLVARHGVRRDVEDTTTAVIMVTSTYTYTTLCSNARDCPASATVVLTSTTVVATTTTICSTPGAVLPSVTDLSSIASSALPIAPGSSSASSGPAFSISIIPGSSIDFPASSSALNSLPVISGTPAVPGLSYMLPSLTPTVSAPAVSGTPSSSVQSRVSTSSGSSATDATSVSFGYSTALSSGYVSKATSPPNTNTGVTRATFTVTSSGSTSAGSSLSSGYGQPSGSSVVSSDTNMGAVSTSYPTASAGFNSTGPYTPAGPSTPVGPPLSVGPSSSAGASTPVGYSTPAGPPSSTGPTSSADATYTPGPSYSTAGTLGPSSEGQGHPSTPVPGTTVSATHTTLRPTTLGSYYELPPSATESESIIDSTVRVTSYLTQTMTSFVTAPTASSKPDSSEVDATYTLFPSGVSALPSRSGYLTSSGFPNGTVVSPRPTYSEVPVNMGQIVGAGKNSLAAIVVALVFAHFA